MITLGYNPFAVSEETTDEPNGDYGIGHTEQTGLIYSVRKTTQGVVQHACVRKTTQGVVQHACSMSYCLFCCALTLDGYTSISTFLDVCMGPRAVNKSENIHIGVLRLILILSIAESHTSYLVPGTCYVRTFFSSSSLFEA